MSEATDKPAFSGPAMILLGLAFIVGGGLIGYILLPGTAVGAVFVIAAFAGIAIAVIGTVQAVREHTRHRQLADEAARVMITSTPVPSFSAELQRLDALHKQGSLSDDEFAAAKAKALAN